jgi:hypothetical protein
MDDWGKWGLNSSRPLERCRQHPGGGVKTIKKIMINPNTLLGRFFFQKTDNGNLIGEYSNNLGTGVSTESADWIKGCEDKECANCKYHGTYHSSWLEGREPQFAELKISQKPGDPKLFKLEWREDKNPNPIYVGEGMLCDGILIGDYHDTN